MKMRFISAVSFTVAAATAVFACSSPSNGGGTAGACQSYGSALIAYQQRCTGTIDPNRQAEDTSRYVQLCEGALALPGVKDISGQLNSCASNLTNASCNASINQIPDCDIEPTGNLADGAACAIGAECQSGDCTVTSSGTVGDGGETTCGTCAPALADGASCANGGTCVSGDTCKFDSATDGGFSATCTKKSAPGDVGATCSDNSGCTPPNYCSFTGSGTGSETGTCTAPTASGGACTSSGECAAGLVCTGQTARTCGQPVAEGGACGGSDCAAGLACDFNTTKCVKIQFAAAGAGCDDNTVRCSQGTCVEQAQPGGGGSGGGTGSLSGTCPTIIADGQPCTGNDGTSQCDDYASCIDGKCAFVPAACK